MAIRTILAGLSGGSASNGTSELACRFAARFGAHLTALHVRPDVASFVAAAGAEGLVAAATMRWATEMSDVLEVRRKQTKANFAAAAARHGVRFTDGPGTPNAPSAAWREETGEAPALISYYARFFDLVVLGRSDRVIDSRYTDVIEHTLMQSGRPVLLAPADPAAAVGEVVAIAWNGSAQAVRALVGALPFLRLARESILVEIGPGHEQGLQELQAYLHQHGVTARLKTVPAAFGKGSGHQLLSAAHDESADLLVLGGYGHAPWREALFGGTTSELVSTSLLPLLLAH